MKCPHCRTGKLFKKRWPKNYTELVDLNETCPVCKHSALIEPGFFYGSMYVSYMINVGVLVSTWIAFTLFVGSVFDYTWTFLSIVIFLMLVLWPYAFRLARSVWAHMFIPYKDKSTSKE
ncbi:MAG TPA: DUF983 domain-containing protein [Flavobacteriales bacterium]|nr:DUF983 domain-containing protein [Flavobacteriales bacterium]